MTFPMLVEMLLSPWQHSPDHHLTSPATTHSQRKQLICCQLLSGVLSPAGSSGLRSRPEQAGTLPNQGIRYGPDTVSDPACEHRQAYACCALLPSVITIVVPSELQGMESKAYVKKGVCH